jgi:hypothetical protein
MSLYSYNWNKSSQLQVEGPRFNEKVLEDEYTHQHFGVAWLSAK